MVGTETGYRTWQNQPNAPEEAYSDTGGPFTALFLGWAPSLALLGIFYAVLLVTRGSQVSAPPSVGPRLTSLRVGFPVTGRSEEQSSLGSRRAPRDSVA